MSKITCNTIADILPLYVDDIVSDDTKFLVSEHLAQCENCRKKYESMKGTVTIPAKTDIKQLKNFKNSWKKKTIFLICATVILTVGIMLCLNYMSREMWNVTFIFILPVIFGAVIRVFCFDFRRSYLITVVSAILSGVMFIVALNPPVRGNEYYGLWAYMLAEFALGSLMVKLVDIAKIKEHNK